MYMKPPHFHPSHHLYADSLKPNNNTTGDHVKKLTIKFRKFYNLYVVFYAHGTTICK